MRAEAALRPDHVLDNPAAVFLVSELCDHLVDGLDPAEPGQKRFLGF
jgi:hypothetical protein